MRCRKGKEQLKKNIKSHKRRKKSKNEINVEKFDDNVSSNILHMKFLNGELCFEMLLKVTELT